MSHVVGVEIVICPDALPLFEEEKLVMRSRHQNLTRNEFNHRGYELLLQQYRVFDRSRADDLSFVNVEAVSSDKSVVARVSSVVAV